MDKKLSYVLSAGTLAALLLAFLLPSPLVGRMIAAACLLTAGLLAQRLLKKRSIPSVHQRQVLLIMLASGLMYVTLQFLVGIRFGFYKNGYGPRAEVILRFILPITAIIVFGEILRHVLLSQQKKGVTLFAYFGCLIGDLLIFTSLGGIYDFSSLIDLIGMTLFPAIVSNVLYHHLSARYGALPNIAFRLIATVLPFAISISPATPSVMSALAALCLPLLLYWFIDLLYEKKKRHALQKSPRWMRVLRTVSALLVVLLMLGTVLVISNRFHYGTYIVATSSMEEEISPGDAVIYEKWEGEHIATGDILVFDRNGTVVIHRVTDIEIINGEYRYYTKGDANAEPDEGYVTNSQIIGVVIFKIPFVGNPVLWARQLFANK